MGSSKHYLTFNTTLLGAAVALSKNVDTVPARAGLFGLLLVAAMNSYAGMQATSIGHAYYQRTRNTKSDLEKVLGLGAYSIQSTPGMRRDHDSVALGTPEAKAGRFGSIVQQTRALLGVLCAFSSVGAVGALTATIRSVFLD